MNPAVVTGKMIKIANNAESNQSQKNPDEWSDPLTGSNLYCFDVFKIHIAVFSTHFCAWDYFRATLIF